MIKIFNQTHFLFFSHFLFLSRSFRNVKTSRPNDAKQTHSYLLGLAYQLIRIQYSHFKIRELIRSEIKFN